MAESILARGHSTLLRRCLSWCVVLWLVGCSRDAGWVEVNSSEYKFKVKVPEGPREKKEQTKDGRAQTNWRLVYPIDTAQGHYNITAAHMADEQATKETIEGFRDFVLKTTNGKLVKESKIIKNNVLVGIDVEAEWMSDSTRVKTRSVKIYQNRVEYLLTINAEASWQGWKDADRFFNSFEVLP